MLGKLRSPYRQAKTILLLLDNYVPHKIHKVEVWLADNPKFILIFLPIYSPRMNKIELLWLSRHETVMRNHQCRYFWQLLGNVERPWRQHLHLSVIFSWVYR